MVQSVFIYLFASIHLFLSVSMSSSLSPLMFIFLLSVYRSLVMLHTLFCLTFAFRPYLRLCYFFPIPFSHLVSVLSYRPTSRVSLWSTSQDACCPTTAPSSRCSTTTPSKAEKRPGKHRAHSRSIGKTILCDEPLLEQSAYFSDKWPSSCYRNVSVIKCVLAAANQMKIPCSPWVITLCCSPLLWNNKHITSFFYSNTKKTEICCAASHNEFVREIY